MLFALLLFCCTDQASTGDSAGTDSGAVVQAAPLRLAEPAAWMAPGKSDSAAFPWGAQSGDPTQDSAILSVRTDLAQLTGLVMADDGAGGWVELARPTLVRDKDSIVARATLEGLATDTAYSWAATNPSPT